MNSSEHHIGALKAQGLDLLKNNRLAEARALFAKICDIDSSDAEAWYVLSGINGRLGNIEEAGECSRRVIALRPDHSEAHANLGNVLFFQGNYDAAAKHYQTALRINPNQAGTYNNLGNLFKAMGRVDDAASHYRQALRLNPNLAEVHINLGTVLSAQGRLDEALMCYRKALRLAPNNATAHSNLGNLLKTLDRGDEAEASYGKALRLDPRLPEAHNNLGSLLVDQARLDEAMACFQEALRLKPDFVQAYNNMGNVYTRQGNHDEALACFREALRLDPGNAIAHSNLLFLLCYRSDYDVETLFAEHVRWGEMHGRDPREFPAHGNSPDGNRRLRIGYVSADFRNHPVGHFIEQVIAHHDKRRFEIFCYYNYAKNDDITARLRRHADHWRSIIGWTDEAVARQIREDGIDILVDLAGHTAGNRLLTFALKPAPVQATWMSYIATTGLKAIDYIIANRFIIPPQDERYYVERVVRLPHSFLCFTPPHFPIEVSPPPALSRGEITFGCFNSTAKLTTSVIAAWARILLALPRSRLFLKSGGFGDELSRARYRKLFAEHGVAPERLKFAGLSPRGEYLAAYNEVDIGLDPFPYNGGTTTVEALWMGVPVITLSGDRFVSRMGESIMMNLGLAECVAATEDEYIAKALGLASDLPRLAELRGRLRAQLLASPLCDGPGFTRDLEAAYRQMWTAWCRSQAPAQA